MWKTNPKIFVLSAAISDKNNYVDCVLCSHKKDLCHFHSNLPNQSSVNFVSTLREIDLHGIFYDFFNDFGVESDEKMKCTKNYEPVFKMPTNSLRKKTKFYTNNKAKGTLAPERG